MPRSVVTWSIRSWFGRDALRRCVRAAFVCSIVAYSRSCVHSFARCRVLQVGLITATAGLTTFEGEVPLSSLLMEWSYTSQASAKWNGSKRIVVVGAVPMTREFGLACGICSRRVRLHRLCAHLVHSAVLFVSCWFAAPVAFAAWFASPWLSYLAPPSVAPLRSAPLPPPSCCCFSQLLRLPRWWRTTTGPSRPTRRSCSTTRHCPARCVERGAALAVADVRRSFDERSVADTVVPCSQVADATAAALAAEPGAAAKMVTLAPSEAVRATTITTLLMQDRKLKSPPYSQALRDVISLLQNGDDTLRQCGGLLVLGSAVAFGGKTRKGAKRGASRSPDPDRTEVRRGRLVGLRCVFHAGLARHHCTGGFAACMR